MKTLPSLTLLMAAALAHAGAPDKMALPAGAQPTEAQAREVVTRELIRTVRDPADLGRVRFVSGPTLSSGVNFAEGREQAWLMCVVTGTANLRNRNEVHDVEVKPYLLRTREGQLVNVSVAGWKDSDIHC